MIIFDLDGTLANCEHRKHFVTNPCKDKYIRSSVYSNQININPEWEKFKPNWEAFEDACDKDIPNEPIISIFNMYVSMGMGEQLHIWTGRQQRKVVETLKWVQFNLICFDEENLRMRPNGDYIPDEKLKERWLDEAITKGEKPEMVFDDRDKVVKMWRRRGITCLQVADGDF